MVSHTHHNFIARHRTGITTYTTTLVLAGCCVLSKQSHSLILCHPHTK